MNKAIRTLLLTTIAAIVVGCQEPVETAPEAEPQGAGTCIPITYPEEFTILAWYEIININAESKLEEFKSDSAEWRLQKLVEAGFNTYFDYRISLEEAEALLTLGDKVGMKIIAECHELHDSTTTKMAVEAMSAHPSLYAYNVWDEPEISEYPEVVRRIKEIYKYDKIHPCITFTR